MTDFPNCALQCEYYKNGLETCKKYKQIPKEIANGKKVCKEYKKKKRIRH